MYFILAIVSATAVTLFAILFLIFLIFAVIIGHIYGAPFVRSKKGKVRMMIELSGIKSGEMAIDLGSGDGSLVIEAARRGAQAIGVEINPFLVSYSRRRIKKAGLGDRAKIIQKNFYRYPLNDADVIFLYLWPSTIEKLKEKLVHELKPATRIISNGFQIPGWRAILEKDKVYVYGR